MLQIRPLYWPLSSDLTVKPSYERTIAQDAHTAALLAKRDESSLWTRDDEARTATMKSVGSGYTGVTGVVNGGSIYKVATKNSTGTMSTRLDPVKDYRHGLAAKGSAAALNIAKINQVATHNSNKSLNSRFNPDLDYRLKTSCLSPWASPPLLIICPQL